MRKHIFLGLKMYLESEIFNVISHVDDDGYFVIESDSFTFSTVINISELVLDGYSYTGMPLMKYSRMDYDLGI